jgi:hypothetical protein
MEKVPYPSQWPQSLISFEMQQYTILCNLVISHNTLTPIGTERRWIIEKKQNHALWDLLTTQYCLS